MGPGRRPRCARVFGLVELDAGELLWDGRPIELAERLRFGYMPEERGLYPRMPAGEQVAYFGRLHGLEARDARAAATDWLERLGLGDRAGAKVEELSHGNQQRAQLAAALVHTPELLVLDEPFAGLDPVAGAHLRGPLRRGGARHCRRLLEPSAGSGRGHLRGGRDHRPRPHRRERRSRRAETGLAAPSDRAAARGALPEWLPEVAGVELVERRNGDLRLLVGRDVDPEEVLAAAERSARVVEFNYGPPSLDELFLELVAT